VVVVVRRNSANPLHHHVSEQRRGSFTTWFLFFVCSVLRWCLDGDEFGMGVVVAVVELRRVWWWRL
jgi:hypothetical protein